MNERRTGSRALETIYARREREARAHAQRNAPAMRRAFWERKAAEAERAEALARETESREAQERAAALSAAQAAWHSRFQIAAALAARESGK